MTAANPPIVEMYVGAQFATERAADSAKLVLFWNQHLRATYPHVAEAPALDDEFEKFGDGLAGMPVALQLRFDSRPRVRYQFVNESQDRMVQLQASRLNLNWQQKGAGYPRFSALEREFLGTLNHWQEFAGSHGVGEVVPNQWELCYVNFIPQGELWQTPGDWHRISPLFVSKLTDFEPLVLEDRSFQWRMLLPQSSGRITLTALQTMNETGRLGLQLTILARGPAVTTAELDGRLQQAHSSILKLFDTLAAEDAKRHWGLTAP